MAAKHVVLIAGASAGIGAATALELAGRSHTVALLARSASKIEELAADIQADGGTALAVTADIAAVEATRAACAATAAQLGPITALVNCAATIEPIAPFADADPAAFAACVATNFTGAWNLCAALVPGMVAAGGGVVVNLSSGASARPMEGWSAYCSTKAGLAMLTRMLNHEYGDQGVAAYGFRPGLVASAMQDTIRASGVNPISQLPASELRPPQDAARAITWLVENRPEQWRDETEPDIRDPGFAAAAGL